MDHNNARDVTCQDEKCLKNITHIKHLQEEVKGLYDSLTELTEKCDRTSKMQCTINSQVTLIGNLEAELESCNDSLELIQACHEKCLPELEAEKRRFNREKADLEAEVSYVLDVNEALLRDLSIVHETYRSEEKQHQKGMCSRSSSPIDTIGEVTYPSSRPGSRKAGQSNSDEKQQTLEEELAGLVSGPSSVSGDTDSENWETVCRRSNDTKAMPNQHTDREKEEEVWSRDGVSTGNTEALNMPEFSLETAPPCIELPLANHDPWLRTHHVNSGIRRRLNNRLRRMNKIQRNVARLNHEQTAGRTSCAQSGATVRPGDGEIDVVEVPSPSSQRTALVKSLGAGKLSQDVTLSHDIYKQNPVTDDAMSQLCTSIGGYSICDGTNTHGNELDECTSAESIDILDCNPSNDFSNYNACAAQEFGRARCGAQTMCLYGKQIEATDIRDGRWVATKQDERGRSAKPQRTVLPTGFVRLGNLRKYASECKLVNVLAVVNAHVNQGKNEYHAVFLLTDESRVQSTPVQTTIFARDRAMLPIASPGDCILLRGFSACYNARLTPSLIESSESEWYIWDGLREWTEPQVVGEEEKQELQRLRNWWESQRTYCDCDVVGQQCNGGAGI